jgi:transforming growth factor-beta-induced protein
MHTAMKSWLSFGALALATTGLVAQDGGKKLDIVQTAAKDGRFKTLLAAASAAGLTDTLSGEGPFTVFAPTDEAFAKLGDRVQELLKPERKADLQKILLYHVVPGEKLAADVIESKFLDTAAKGKALRVEVDGDSVSVGGAKVVITDIEASNGVIHVIDRVMLPDDSTIVSAAAGSSDFATLVAAVKAAGLVDVLAGDGPYTVFAPTNEAFAKLGSTVEELLKPGNRDKLVSILKYHVVPGRRLASDVVGSSFLATAQGADLTVATRDGGAFVNDAKIVKTDMVVGNGVIHVIDSVVTPPPSIVATAAGDDRFSTLVTAVKAADLAKVLGGEGPFTVFAPTNAAFAKLPEGTIPTLLADKEALRKVLGFHVVRGTIHAGDLKPEQTVKTLAGASLKITVGEKGARAGDANIVATDIVCGNGVIHVIDQVLQPRD